MGVPMPSQSLTNFDSNHLIKIHRPSIWRMLVSGVIPLSFVLTTAAPLNVSPRQHVEASEVTTGRAASGITGLADGLCQNGLSSGAEPRAVHIGQFNTHKSYPRGEMSFGTPRRRVRTCLTEEAAYSFRQQDRLLSVGSAHFQRFSQRPRFPIRGCAAMALPDAVTHVVARVRQTAWPGTRHPTSHKPAARRERRERWKSPGSSSVAISTQPGRQSPPPCVMSVGVLPAMTGGSSRAADALAKANRRWLSWGGLACRPLERLAVEFIEGCRLQKACRTHKLDFKMTKHRSTEAENS
ncbi:hypothetical protein POSPLADRAFT_1047257 [Postia placenta MAD-698-R-SB12]|uniref:Uncharacterized protein n=1 Tax=Postia placenta MAD-698-R-SB12 TaxID=670580 RepID=A0A1X6MXH4_9APHY|nr:hypothetical protein POSPLADRAFT_1047257 [Postia placenta MAD-698-R-SB12]OSX60952.1 hypothetical protein POSPLADRAFT_1047257 [Postia placenta MAD-698-R-SB12]